MLDVGGESTRPQGATPVGSDEELRRVLPVLRAVREACPGVPISVDTVKASVAAAALEAGASVINDVSGLRIDPAIAGLCAACRGGARRHALSGRRRRHEHLPVCELWSGCHR